MRLASSLTAALALAACAGTDVRTQIPQRDEFGRPTAFGDDPVDAWQYHVETQRMDGPIEGPSQAIGGGLRVAVSSSPGLSGTADVHALVEGTPTALPVARCRWPKAPNVSAAVAAPAWSGAEVTVDWVVSVRPRGRCAVVIEAVPRITSACACAVMTDLTVRRVLGLDDAIVLGVDPLAPAVRQAEALVGAPAGRAGRFVIRVRG